MHPLCRSLRLLLTAGMGGARVKTSACFHASLVRSLLRGLRAFRVEKIAKNFAQLDRLQNFAKFLHSLGGDRAFPAGPVPCPVEAFTVVICDGSNTSIRAVQLLGTNVTHRIEPMRSKLVSEDGRSRRLAPQEEGSGIPICSGYLR